jgi:hypothetical protein
VCRITQPDISADYLRLAGFPACESLGLEVIKMLKLREENGKVFVCGRTYPLRGELKQAGLRWDRTRQMWWGRDRETAEDRVTEMTERLLANPTLHDYDIELEEQ